MGISKKFFALMVVACALAIVPIALAAGLTVKTTPTHPKKGQTVKMTVTGLKAGEKVKAVLTLPATGQRNTYFPRQRASSTGAFVNSVKAQVKGKNVWTYTGRTSHRKGSTSFTVK